MPRSSRGAAFTAAAGPAAAAATAGAAGAAAAARRSAAATGLAVFALLSATPVFTAGAAGPGQPTSQWSAAQPAASPPPLSYAASAYDADTAEIVLFGGLEADGHTLSNQTWLYNGRTWAQAHPLNSPPARDLASIAFDPSTTPHELILFGGRAQDGTLLGDTWAWNGADWTQQPYGGPSARQGASMAYDHSGRLVLFGGTGEIGNSSSPSQSSPTSTAQVVQDIPLGDTWQWTGTTWVPSAAVGPPPRTDAAMAWDSTAQTTVLFSGSATAEGAGGASLLTDTWLWNGSQWTSATPTTRPPGRIDAVFEDEPAVGGSLLVTGQTASGATDDSWVWSGTTWTEANTSGTASPRTGASGAPAPAAALALLPASTPASARRAAVTLFGGTAPGGAALGDTETVAAAPAPPPPPPPPTTTPATVPGSPTTAPPATVPKPAPTTTTSTTRPPPPPTTSPPPPTTTPNPTIVTIGADRSTMRRGEKVLVSGSGFRPLSTVTISFHSFPTLLGQVVAGTNGAFETTVEVPSGAAPGQHWIVAAGVSYQGTSAQVETPVTVLGTSGSRGPSNLDKTAMFGLALAIPVAAWLTLVLRSELHRRRAR